MKTKKILYSIITMIGMFVLLGFNVYASDFFAGAKDENVEIILKSNSDKETKKIEEFVKESKVLEKYEISETKIMKKITKRDLNKNVPGWIEPLNEIGDERKLFIVSFKAKNVRHHRIGFVENALITLIYDAETESYIGGQMNVLPPLKS